MGQRISIDIVMMTLENGEAFLKILTLFHDSERNLADAVNPTG